MFDGSFPSWIGEKCFDKKEPIGDLWYHEQQTPSGGIAIVLDAVDLIDPDVPEEEIIDAIETVVTMFMACGGHYLCNEAWERIERDILWRAGLTLRNSLTETRTYQHIRTTTVRKFLKSQIK